jgi:hypothetical protein
MSKLPGGVGALLAKKISHFYTVHKDYVYRLMEDNNVSPENAKTLMDEEDLPTFDKMLKEFCPRTYFQIRDHYKQYL